MSPLVELAYLAAAALFILGLKRQQSPATARSGNRMASLAMLGAVVVTLLAQSILTPVEMIAGLAVGGLIGAALARNVAMTAMPELVAAFNGFGGLASALVALAEVVIFLEIGPAPTLSTAAVCAIAASILIGTVTFTGSFVAFGKLNGTLSGNPISFPGMRLLTLLIIAGALGGIALMIAGIAASPYETVTMLQGMALLGGTAFVLGVLLVIPIGGADMPVVVSLLNAYSGLAAAATGFAIDNVVLIVSGALVGAAGFILTRIMCQAMNRSLTNVLLGGFGGDAGSAPNVEGAREDRPVHETTADDVAILLSYADQVVIAPGYGLAVAQAQHPLAELADLLKARGVIVKYAIHPVAGRMPGHMNVLLAEAKVPYEELFEMDDINSEFATTDVTLVVGANDVVNPSARTDAGSPIYGMPILNVDESEQVVVLKRSLRPGYSGIDNDLFYSDNTRMLFGDAKESLSDLVVEVKELA